MKKTILPLLFLSTLLLSGCGNPDRKDKIFGSGSVEATEINVSAKVVGRISVLAVREGDMVQPGALIAKLDDLEQAQKDFSRVEALYEKKIVPAEQLEKSQKIRENFVIYAPSSGTVILQEMNQGEVATPGAPIVTIAEMEDLWIKIYVAETEIGKLKLGAPAEIEFDAFPKENFKGTVTYISQTAEFIPKNIQAREERANQVFAVKVSLKNIGGKLKIGMPAEVYIDK